MCSLKGCEYACAVEGVASTHAQAVASSHAQLNGLRVCMHIAQLKGLRVRSAVGYLLSQ